MNGSIYRKPPEYLVPDGACVTTNKRTIRLEIDGDDFIAERMRMLCERTKSAQSNAKERLDALTEGQRRGLEEPPVLTDEEIWGKVLLEGVNRFESADGRAPNSVLNIRDVAMDNFVTSSSHRARTTFAKDEVVNFQARLPIGCEIMTGECSVRDAENWDVSNFVFGALNLVSPYGSTAPVPLSTFRHITRHDLLSTFKRMKTKIDVLVCLTLRCRADGATFDGYRLFVYQEEQACAIQTRIEPVPCDHREVEQILYADMVGVPYGVFPHLPLGMSPLSMSPLTAPPSRYRCLACRREVQKIA